MKTTFLLATLLLCISLTDVRAEENRKDEKPRTPTAEAPSVYTMPDSKDSNALVAFCKALIAYTPVTAKDRELYREKSDKLLTEAGEKLLEIEKDDSTDNGHFALHVLIYAADMNVRSPEVRSPRISKFVDTLIESPKLNKEDILMLRRADGIVLKHFHPEKAKVFFARLAKSAARSNDPETAAEAATLEGVVRQLNIVGQPVTVKGKTVAGKQFDISDWKGKIVLVDFWTTWCGACRAELPNVKSNYAKYHSKGFEVVGISDDDDPAALEKFLAGNPLPWPTLYETAGGKYKPNPALSYYGIISFPTTLLVGKDGSVIAVNARGPKLGELLKEQLGEPLEANEKLPDATNP